MALHDNVSVHSSAHVAVSPEHLWFRYERSPTSRGTRVDTAIVVPTHKLGMNCVKYYAQAVGSQCKAIVKFVSPAEIHSSI